LEDLPPPWPRGGIGLEGGCVGFILTTVHYARKVQRRKFTDTMAWGKCYEHRESPQDRPGDAIAEYSDWMK